MDEVEGGEDEEVVLAVWKKVGLDILFEVLVWFVSLGKRVILLPLPKSRSRAVMSRMATFVPVSGRISVIKVDVQALTVPLEALLQFEEFSECRVLSQCAQLFRSYLQRERCVC